MLAAGATGTAAAGISGGMMTYHIVQSENPNHAKQVRDQHGEDAVFYATCMKYAGMIGIPLVVLAYKSAAERVRRANSSGEIEKTIKELAQTLDEAVDLVKGQLKHQPAVNAR